MGSVSSDLRYALRELRRRPAFTLTAVLSLALGIGATSAVFSVIHAVLINPFPYGGADRMMGLALQDKTGRYRYTGFHGLQMEQLRQVKSIESVVAEDGWNLTTTDGDIPEDVQAAYISPNAPNHWAMPALKGRWLIPSDGPPGQEPERVVVLRDGRVVPLVDGGLDRSAVTIVLRVGEHPPATGPCAAGAEVAFESFSGLSGQVLGRAGQDNDKPVAVVPR